MPTDRRASPGPGGPPGARAARWIRWALIAAVVAGGLGLALSSAPKADVTVSGTGAVGNPAPAITMTDFEGEHFELSDYRGRPLVVNFWASWCPSCVADMPDFEKVHQATAGQIEFLGLNQSDVAGTRGGPGAQDGGDLSTCGRSRGRDLRGVGGRRYADDGVRRCLRQRGRLARRA